MILDVRLPIGVLFLLVGAILVACGIFAPGPGSDVNINLVWGAVLMAFAAVMLALVAAARRAGAKSPESQH